VPADQIVVATVRAASWPEAAKGGSAAVEAASVDAALPSHTRFVGLAAGATDRPDLQSAKRVVSGGRGVGSEENFKVIFQLADKLGAAVGASRAAVDAGYVPSDRDQGRRHDRGDQQGPGLADLRDRRYRVGRGSVHVVAGAGKSHRLTGSEGAP
jgi:electron transfer flavoprotein alpha subunit